MNRINPVILVFAHRRPSHLRATLAALSRNNYTSTLPLRIYVDGPRDIHEATVVSSVVKTANAVNGFAKLNVIERELNYGLYRSLTSGISESLEEYDSVLVFEDDILTSPYAVQFLIDGLAMYKGVPNVCSIHAYTPPLKQMLPNTFFLRGADCWGWATWREQWACFRHDAREMAFEIKNQGLIYDFNLNGNYPYYKMLCDKAAGKNNSWAICWHASCFLANKLTLYPARSLVQNIGLDHSGEHCGPSDLMNSTISLSPVSLKPIEPMVDPFVSKVYSKHFHQGFFNKFNRTIRGVQKDIQQLFTCYPLIRPNRLPLVGRYKSFQEASKACSGYSDSAVLEKVAGAVIEVLDGNARYERDGTVFSSLPNQLMIRSVLLDIASQGDAILDFGGGLGGTYINHRDILPPAVKFYVVEQPTFVMKGRDISQEYHLPISFFESIGDLPFSPRIVILSSVLQYLPDFRVVLSSILDLLPQYIVIDRTMFSNDTSWKLQVNRDYYESTVSYPCRGISFSSLLSLCNGYKVINKWTNPFDAQSPRHMGILLERNVQ
jgi:putative methyltransferase (TIGR04325 family)